MSPKGAIRHSGVKADGINVRQDGTRHDELRVRVFAGTQPSQFTLYEDDGETIRYQRGELRKSVIAQQPAARSTDE